MQEWHFIT